MQQQNLVTLTIDGREVSVPPGSTVLHAAEQLGIEIPTFCYNKKMDPLGACRMCLVSIERAKGFPPACATPVAAGMVVRTVSEDVVKTQRGMLELLLINHPLDCPICDKGGECPLQNLTFKYGPGKSRYTEEKRHFVKHLPIGPHIVLDRERCIVCQLCVRFMEDVADDPQIVLLNRGGKTEVNVFPDHPFDSPFAGNTMELCPVGALTTRDYRFRARPWDLEHTPSICPTCAVGCNVTLDTRRGELLRLMAREKTEVDDGWLCDYGRFATLARAHAGASITAPLVRRDGALQETSWEDALSVAAEGLSRARGATIAALADPRSTNEELYLLGRLFRTALRSPNVAVPGASSAPTLVAGGAPIEAMEHADVIVLFDADPVARQHVLDLRLKKQVKRRGAKLVILSNEKTSLDYMATAKAPFEAGNPANTIRRLQTLLAPPAAEPSASTSGSLGEIVATVTNAVTSAAQEVAGVVAHAVEGIARLALGRSEQSDEAPPEVVSARSEDDPLAAVAAVLREAQRGLVLYDERVLVEQDLAELAQALRALAAQIAPADGAVHEPLALAAAANSRGAAEMGAHGAWLAGGIRHDDAEAAAKLAKAWGSQPTLEAGKSVTEILAGTGKGLVRALYLLEYDPIAAGVPNALQSLTAVPFVVLQTARSGPALESADVVFPSGGYGEAVGTLTNTEGRVQRVGRAMRLQGEAREGWQILADLITALGGTTSYLAAEDVTQEIARVTGLASWSELLIKAVEPVLAGGAR